MAGGGNGREENYWPGFVDALSNVVLTLVFVLVIFVFALVMASNKVEKKMQEIVQMKKQEEQLAASAAPMHLKELETALAAAQAKIEELQKQVEAQKSATTTPDSAQTIDKDNDNVDVEQKDKVEEYVGTMSMKESQNLITLNFPQSVAKMDEKSAAQLEGAFKQISERVGPHKIVLRSIIGRESFSIARRMAYYRALDVRNFLITKAGESPASISSVIIQPEKVEDGRVEIVIQKN